jgi:aromatic-L-amino-acid decarboxylase
MLMRLLLDPVELSKTGDMDTETLRRYGHQIVDWIVGYLDGIGDYPVLSRVAPGDIQRRMPSQAPQRPETMDAILADLHRLVIPGITHWNAGSFMGYFGLTSSGPSMLAEMFDAAFNVTRMLWRTSPAATELEQVTLHWLRQMLGLPDSLFGMLHHNSAVLHALVAAREALGGLQISRLGMAGRREIPRLRLYASQEAHTSVDKAAIVLGLGLEGIRKIGTDAAFRMNVGELVQAIEEDRRAGWLPFAVVATVGTTSTTSVDPVPIIADVCERYGLWLHVDAAYGGAAAIVPSKRWVLAGCERADSLTINPHKWLFTSFGCSVFFTRRPALLKAALSLTPDYLNNSEGQNKDVPNLMDYDFSLPHRFPALKLWMVLRYFGQQGLATRIQEHCQLASRLAEWIDAVPGFERMAPVPLSVVCFRVHPVGIDNETVLDVLNEKVLNRINAAGHYFLSHTRVHGKFTIRVAISNIRTTEGHVEGLWEELQGALQIEVNALKRREKSPFQGIVRMLQ